MTTPLSRPISDYRNVRSTSGADLTVSMGQSLRSVFSEPMEGSLIAKSFGRAGARSGSYTLDQFKDFQRGELERQAESRRITHELNNYALPDSERESLTSRLLELDKEGELQRDYLTRQSIEAGRLETPEDLTQRYGELGLRFDRPMTKREAQLLADEKRAEIVRRAIVEKGPRGVFPGMAKFGAGMLAVATDPVGLASMFVPIVGPAGRVALAARFGKIGGRTVEGAIEGGVGNLLVEPLYYGLSKQAQLDYTMVDSLLNVGVGFALGGTIGGAMGAGAGVLGRLREGPRSAEAGAQVGTPPAVEAPPPRPTESRAQTSAEHQRDVAQTAIRQMVNDEPVNVVRFLDGTDLRSTTTLSRFNGYEYQRQQILDEMTAMQLRPTYLVADEEGIIRTDTLDEARALAAEVDGEAVPLGDGYAIRRRAKGDVARKPSGEVASFKDQSRAEKFAEHLREQGEVIDIVFREAEADYVIARDMSDEDIESLQVTSAAMEVPTGVDVKSLAVRASETDPIQKAVRSVLAERTVAQKIVEDQEKAAQVSEEAVASREIDEELAVSRQDDIAALEEEITGLESQLKEAGIVKGADDAEAETDLGGDDIPTKFQRMPVEPLFYSPTLRAIEGAKQAKAPAKDWMAVLSKSQAVKKAELEWLGVPEYLESRGKEQVTKEELAEFVRANTIELKEVVLRDISVDEQIRATRAFRDARRNIEAELNFIVREEGLDDADFEVSIALRTILGTMATPTPNTERIVTRFNELENSDVLLMVYDRTKMAAAEFDQYLDEGETINQTQFEEYTEEGGNNYRELLLTLPNLHRKGKNRPPALDRTEADRIDDEMRSMVPEGMAPADLPPEQLERWKELRKQRHEAGVRSQKILREQSKEPFVNLHHFGEPNIVVHARVKDRVGPNGEKVLFVEEIQSDLETAWREAPDPEQAAEAQRIRDEFQVVVGDYEKYKTEALIEIKTAMKEAGPPWYDYADTIDELDINYSFSVTNAQGSTAINKFVESKPVGTFKVYEKAWELYDKRAKLQDEILRLGTNLEFNPYLPETPFRGEATYQLMVKRLLREAAEKGYDRLSWTPGYMQAERWNAAAQEVVEEIKWDSNDLLPVANRIVTLKMADDGPTLEASLDAEGRILEHEGVPEEFYGKHIKDLVGPGLARQIMEEPEGTADPGKITFPSSGYAIAYDQHIRRAVDKFAKKYGGKVFKDETLPDFRDEPTYESFRRKARDLGKDNLLNLAVEKGVLTREEAENVSANNPVHVHYAFSPEELKIMFLVEPQPSSAVWSVDITPDMRDAAQQPQPILRTPLPGAMHVRAEIAEEALSVLREELDTMGLSDVGLKVDQSAEWQGAFKPSQYGPMDILIASAIDSRATLYHESVHAMKWMDLFKEDEWALLTRSAEEVWMKQFDIETRYPELSREQQLEEAIAEAFGEFAVAKTRPESRLLQIWQKVERLFEAIRTAFKGKTADTVFGDMYSGAVGQRARGERGDFETRMQKQPAPEDRLSSDTRRELDTIPEMEKEFEAWKKAVEVAADCVGMRP